jgi:hypothetical protein
MSDAEKCAWAGADQNPDVICISTYSGYRACAYDPQGKETILRPDADDNALGVAVKEALAHSRFLSLDEARKFLDYRRLEQRYDEWIKSLMERQGYKDKTALFGKMKHCGITLSKGIIEIAPTIHEELDSWGRNRSDGIEDVLISADESAERIGAALRLGFSRCVE